MLSDKIKNFCKSKNWWYEEFTQQYSNVILDLEISLDSDFAQFYLHAEQGPTFYSRKKELYQICWSSINSSYMDQINHLQKVLAIPHEYIPLDSFEGEGGFFYNRKTEEVIEIALGEKLKDFLDGKLLPQWKTINSFLEWYFEL
ncbi:hypothetical protein AY601_3483 [Pedobacter cryoconitis]|uniref:SMI1/KNR4 family protein n=1 Tax=Pedobacter cryoconitis TaxID=188932 RepID=A0A127VHE1_9SPHI|nr:hypothetical protein [Pedobacter cryoconitis]AMQ00349.1 hypothetical protein AY601_3483 [Pedobacter cryoconitis]